MIEGGWGSFRATEPGPWIADREVGGGVPGQRGGWVVSCPPPDASTSSQHSRKAKYSEKLIGDGLHPSRLQLLRP